MKAKHYHHLPLNILGTIYFHLLTQHHSGEQGYIKHKQRRLIERTAEERDISLLELKAIGYWIVQQEWNLVQSEYRLMPQSKSGKQ